MPDGGRLSIETANVELDEPYAQGHLDVKPGRYVMLAVSDTGIGMDETTVSRVFEPFFTTKGPGKGTGLGLATVFGIVQQSGGHIWVYSEPANGTTIKIYLPLVEREVSSARLSTVRESVAGTETVLVVEDDAAVRAITTLALKGYGYTVLEAGGGTDAIRICAEYDGPIDILISDVVMPEMGGRRVAEMVSAARPGVRVLFLSGYTDDTVVRFGVLHDEVAFLQKPFTPVSLARKVREVLDA
jgi:CheY-like chemotaxis protein